MNRSLFLLFLLLALPLCAGNGMQVLTDDSGKALPYSCFEPERPVMIPSFYRRNAREFRGIWVSTAWNLDFPVCKTVPEFQKTFLNLIQRVRKAGFTAILFQVRPMNDAFYPSRYAAWSRFLAGQEGKELASGFDPMQFMVRACHAAGLEFHAWINPYRVAASCSCSASEYRKTLAPSNFAVKRPDLVLTVPAAAGRNVLVLDPGRPEVTVYVASVVREILEKYAVDGIVMDDYFYPYEDVGQQDAATFRKYAAKGQSLEDWRRANINTLVRTLHGLIVLFNQKANRAVRFGVSPFGIWANLTPPKPRGEDALRSWRKWPASSLGSPTKGYQSLFSQYADSRKWVKEGWVDYIAPQIYWGFSQDAAPYAAVTDWWVRQVEGTNVDLYIGISITRMGKTPDCDSPVELPNQLTYNSVIPAVKGCVFFSSRSVLNPENSVMQEGLQTVIETYWGGVVPWK